MYRVRVFAITLIMAILMTSVVGYSEEMIFDYVCEFQDIEYSKNVIKNFQPEVSQINMDDVPHFFSVDNNDIPIDDYLMEQCRAHTDNILLWPNYQITVHELQNIISANPYLMIYAGGFGVREFVETGIVYDFAPFYVLNTLEEDEIAAAEIKEGVDAYANYARGITNDRVEQILLVHDKIIEDCDYDESFKQISFHSYGLIKNKNTVCQGYAEIFYLVCEELGIDAEFCRYVEDVIAENEDGTTKIEKEGHIWNYVKIDNQWYHVDLTWDDPAGRIDGKPAYHAYFLASDSSMNDHITDYDWIVSLDEQPQCNSTKYESNYLFNLGGCFTTKCINGEFIADTLFVIGKDLSLSAIFKSKTLYIDYGIINSQASDVNEGYFVVHYFFEDYEKFDVIVCEKDNEMLSLCKGYTKMPASGRYPKHSLSGTQILKSDFSQTGNLTMYTWDISTLKPLSQKVKLN